MGNNEPEICMYSANIAIDTFFPHTVNVIMCGMLKTGKTQLLIFIGYIIMFAER